MTSIIEFYFLMRHFREQNQPAPCRKCRGPIIAPGATCPACGHQPAAYASNQASRFLKGAALGILLGGLGTWSFTGQIDWHATGIISFLVGGILCCFK